MLIGSIVALFFAAILFLGFFLLPSLATAQQQQTTTTTTPPSSSLSITTIPPLTPQEQEQQNRLQNVIAATTANLDETEKQVSGIVFTPRWSEPVWINANSVSVLIAYCLPGEFADSGQEILGGFELEVLESYAIALPQGFMAWMAVIGNEGDQLNRLPAALGVICASDLNNAEARVLSPQEQQQINNINQQFTNIQNTQITDIDQVINIIDDVTTPQNDTGGGVTEPPPTTEQPFRVEIIPNATEGVIPVYFDFEAKITGGTAPYTYSWRCNFPLLLTIICESGDPSEGRQNEVLNVYLDDIAATFNVTLTVTDSKNQTAYDSVQVTARESVECPLGYFYNSTSGQCEFLTFEPADTTPPHFLGGILEGTFHTDDPEGGPFLYNPVAEDDVDGRAFLDSSGILHQDDVGGNITIECNPPSGSQFPIGSTTVQCTAVDEVGNVGTSSWTITLLLEVEPLPPGEIPIVPREQPPAEEVPPPADEEAPVEEEEEQPPAEEQPPPVEEGEEPAAEEEEAATSPPAN